MTDLSEARKALGALEFSLLHDRDVYDRALDLEPHIPAILQCLQDAEAAQELRDAFPPVTAW